MAKPHPAAEPLCYFVAVVIGLAADLTLAFVLRAFVGLPTVVCGAAGFCLGVAVNYLNFESWVFAPDQSARRRLSWQGLVRLFAAAQGAFAVRIGAVWLFSLLALPTIVVFGGAVALSFVVNFVLSRMAIRAGRQRRA